MTILWFDYMFNIKAIETIKIGEISTKLGSNYTLELLKDFKILSKYRNFAKPGHTGVWQRADIMVIAIIVLVSGAEVRTRDFSTMSLFP